jgi:hypothetical protein
MPGQTHERRVFPVELLFMGIPVLLFVLITTAGILFFSTLFYIPLYLEYTRVKYCSTPSDVQNIQVWYSCPLLWQASSPPLAVEFSSPTSGTGSLSTSLGPSSDSSALYSSSFPLWTHQSPKFAFGAGIYSQMGFTIISGKVPPHRIGQAIGFLTVSQLFGSTLAVSLGETIIINLSSTKVGKLVPGMPVAVLKGLLGGTSDSFLTTLPSQIGWKIGDTKICH